MKYFANSWIILPYHAIKIFSTKNLTYKELKLFLGKVFRLEH